MKITCPECSAAYDVPIPLLGGPGRRVRCASCRHVWVPDISMEEQPFTGFGTSDHDPIPLSLHPDTLAEAPVVPAEPAGPGFFSDVQWGYLGRMVAGFVLGWVLVGAVVGGLGAVGKIPAFLAPVAVPMGLADAVHVKGLEIRDTVAHVKDDGVTAVSGHVFNTSDESLVLPILEITPVAADGTESESKRIAMDGGVLDSQGSFEFAAELQGAHDVGSELRLRFIP